MSRYLLFLFLLLTFPGYAVQNQPYQKAEDIPNPKDVSTDYISDPQGILGADNLNSLNQVLATLDRKTGVEAAVVIIHDFNKDLDDFTFATQLFRHWGIGKRHADNGLLLFVTTDRRQYRFITGYGVEGLLPDATLKAIGERILAPAFRQQNYGDGVLKAMQVIQQYLLQPASKKELGSLLQKQVPISTGISTMTIGIIIIMLITLVGGWQLWKLRSAVPVAARQTANIYADVTGIVALVLIGLVVLLVVILFFAGKVTAAFVAMLQVLPVLFCIGIVLYFFFGHLSMLSRLRKHYHDDVNFSGAVQQFYRATWWHVLLSPLIVIFMVIERVRSNRLIRRLVPPTGSDGTPLNRINRDTLSDSTLYLSAGQQKEEQLGSQMYDIWTDKNQEVKVVPHPGYQFDDFEHCSQCGFRTLSKPVDITIQQPTYTNGGRANRLKICRTCDYKQFIEEVVLPRRTRPSESSSSSSGSGSSSTDSGSSSGNWGGGSTGGGGAGGSW